MHTPPPVAFPTNPVRAAQPLVQAHHVQGVDVKIPLQSPTPPGHPGWDAIPETVPNIPPINLSRVNVPEETTWWPELRCVMSTGTNTVRGIVEQYESLPPQRIAMDIETHGTSGSGKWQITCVTAAFRLHGGEINSVLLNPLRRDEDRALLSRIIDHCTTMVFHNAGFDTPIMYAHRLIKFSDIRKIEDTILLSRQLNTISRGGRTLEKLSENYQVAEDSNVGIETAFKAQGMNKNAGYGTSDIDAPFYRRGAMSDTAATLQLWDELYREVINLHAIGQPGNAPKILNLQQAHQLIANVQRAGQVTLQMSATGLNWDREYLDKWLEEKQKEYDDATQSLEAAGIRPGVGADLIELLDKQGHIPSDWPRTEKGALKTDKNAVKELINKNIPLAIAHARVAEHKKNLNYMTSTRDTAEATGRVHAGIQILGAHASGRMCLPTTARILTKRGLLSPSEIKQGDLTPDHNGFWTTISEVHRYPSAAVYSYPTHTGEELICTPEHRWVKQEDGHTVVEPLYEGTSQVITVPRPERMRSEHLADDFPPPDTLTTSEAYAALLAWAVVGAATTDADATLPTLVIGDTPGIGKYLADLADRVFGKDVDTSFNEVTAIITATGTPGGMFSYLQAVCEGTDGDHDTRPDYMVASFDGSSSQVFLQSAVLAGLRQLPGGRVAIDTPDHWAVAIAMAGYRAGLSCYIDDKGPQGVQVVVEESDGVVTVDASQATELDSQPVWCVSTGTGTFTYFDQGRYRCTGNSVNDPPLQQFSEDARPVIIADGEQSLWSVDWSSIEPVLLANMAGDADFIAPFNAGGDLYIPLAKKAGLIPMNTSDEDAAKHPGRKKAKQMLLAAMYGQGMRSLSETMGITVEEAYAIQKGLRKAMAVTWDFMDHVTSITKRTGFSYTIWGRMMDERLPNEIKTHVAVNHFCQGSAADTLMDTVLRMDDAGAGHRIKMLIHDEVVVGERDLELAKHVMSTPPEALRERAKLDPILRIDAQPMGRHWLKV